MERLKHFIGGKFVSGEGERGTSGARYLVSTAAASAYSSQVLQVIKLVQAEVDLGSARVRRPRLELAGSERESSLTLIRETLRMRTA